jgi:hypothetical protein
LVPEQEEAAARGTRRSSSGERPAKRRRQGLEGAGPVGEPAALTGVEAAAPVVRVLTHLLQCLQYEPHDDSQEAPCIDSALHTQAVQRDCCHCPSRQAVAGHTRFPRLRQTVSGATLLRQRRRLPGGTRWCLAG